MRRSSLFLLGFLALTALACGGDDDTSSDNPGQGAGGKAGSAGSGGKAGAGGSSAGSGGSAGSSAGASGKGGSAGAAGSAGSGASAGGGAGGSSGAAGTGGESGQGGEAGSEAGGSSGAGGDAGAAGDAGSAGSAGSEAGGSAGAAGSEAGGSAGAAGGPLCPSGVVCGAGDCCEAGQECVFGSCLAACASAVRCGAQQACCEAGQVCVADSCTAPGNACTDYADCEEDEFCEPTLGKCLPQPPAGPECIFKPPVGKFEPVLEWSWTGSTIKPTFDQVINTPMVFDIDKDGTPDVVIVSSDSFSDDGPAYLRALDGKTGKEKWTASADVYKDANRVQARSTPAVADIDGDGFVEIVAVKMGGGIIAFEHDGKLKWTSKNKDNSAYTQTFLSSAVTIADMEGDGKPEIIVAGVVLESNGTLRFDHGNLSGSNNTSYGAVSIVADVDGDGKQELVTGRQAWKSDGSVLWDNKLGDAYPAIADLDSDGTPELIGIVSGSVRVHNAKTGALLASLDMDGDGAGGPPTVAQFDGKGGPDFASANGSAYNVFTYDAAAKKISILWSKPTQDLSSNRTGSTVFDFEGDGKAEVVYNDECYMRAYAGADGNVLIQIENSSATIHEYPVVADVDGDNNTEIVVAANDLNHKNGNVKCPYPASDSRHGVFVYGDKKDRWVRTRRLWNQHSYHVTNINNDGSVPKPESVSWGPQGFNNYRQSTQGKASYNAADLQVSLAALVDQCPTTITLQATVKNAGSLGVPAGIVVSFYEGVAPGGTFVGSAATSAPILPGGSVSVSLDVPGKPDELSFYVVVDADQGGEGAINECVENNNTASVNGELCGKP